MLKLLYFGHVIWKADSKKKKKKSWLTGKAPDAGKDRGQKEKGVAEDGEVR